MYPEPPLVRVIAITFPSMTIAIAEANEPPPPVIETE